MRFFVTKESLQDSIDYFKSLNITKPEQLGLFFFFKSLGFSNKIYKPFKKAGSLNAEEKLTLLDNLHKIGGIFSPDENGGKFTCLFPFSIMRVVRSNSFYNGGSKFTNLISRARDTVDNTLVDIFLDKGADEDLFKLKNKYIDIIKEHCLNSGERISKVHLSCWLYRFTPVHTPEESTFAIDALTNRDITRVLVKKMERFFNLIQVELDELMIDDLVKNEIVFTDTMISGRELRELLTFEGVTPEVQTEREADFLSRDLITSEDFVKHVELRGDNPTIQEIYDVVLNTKQVVLYGVPGVGKSYLISSLEQNFDEVEKIQFHANTTYEEFIGGTSIKNGSLYPEAGIFLKSIISAKNNPEKRYLFIIDEINRGNISKIFGEAILALDREYEVKLMKSYTIGEDDHESLDIPENIYIIGTMNSADRSIALVDYALRRRFSFIKLVPNYDIVREKADLSDIKIDIEKLFKALNQKLFEVLNDENLLLGHSYFLPKWLESDGKIKWTIKELRFLFNYSILPLMEEYSYGNKHTINKILGEKLSKIILSNEEFEEAIIETFPEVKITRSD